MWATERAEALAEVATYLQDQLDLGNWWKDEPVDLSGCWPVCAAHNLLTLADVRGGVAVWWCSAGHAVADIGSLGAEKSRGGSGSARR